MQTSAGGNPIRPAGRGCAVALIVAWISAGTVSESFGGGTIDLVGQLDPSTGGNLSSEIWGWVDPNTSKEYAIIGEWVGGHVYLIDASVPANPQIASTISGVPGFDLKVWDHYLYLVDGNGSGNDGRIYDISDPENPTFAGSFLSAHNIFIAENGYMYNEFEGLTILDLNADPTNPQVVWSGGFEGHDATVVGDRLYDFHGGAGTNIYDVSDPTSPVLLGNISGFGMVYHHSGWPSADGNYLYVNDELANSPQPDIMVFDISNPASPVLVDSYTDPFSRIHNSYRVGDYLYVSFYSSGFRVFDVTDPLNMLLCDEFETSGIGNESDPWHGAWGCYPFTPSGHIYVSDIEDGLHIFTFTPDLPTSVGTSLVAAPFLEQNSPNPVRQATEIRYRIPVAGPVELAVYNALGQKVRTLVAGARGSGVKSVSWDGRDERDRPVAAGTYFYRLDAGGRSETKRLVVLR